MQPVEIRPSIYWVGVNDRHTELFEGLWSIRNEGVSYNSYLIKDKKKVIIDLCSKLTTDELVDQIKTLVDPSELDYIVINHMEPDHSGALKAMILLAPHVTLLGSAKTREMLESFYGITENVQDVNDGETIDLGSPTLKFVATPFVHWPETMMTYETTEKILFSCDGFGGYGTLDGTIFDDPTVPLAWYEDQALRYFVNIVASFSKPVKNAITKLESLPLEVVAPSHGLVWRNHPQRIIDLYTKWAGYAGQPGDAAVTLLYASMYGNTEKMMEIVAQGVVDQGLPISIFNVSKTSISEILPSLWLKRGVLMGAPTYEGGLFPDMAQVMKMAQRKHIFNKVAAGFGSHAWLGGGQRELITRIETLKWELTGNFEFKGAPDSAELDEGRRFGAEFARKVLAK
jgi:anaerobic nitric oxide reductase flavorubredoxin